METSEDPNVMAWLAVDWHPATRKEAMEMTAEEAAILLGPNAKWMEFGTAGLRSRMGAGYSRMNDVTVLQASQGLCMYLLEVFGTEALEQQGVVIGHDARHNSQRYAHVTASAFLAKGAKVYLYGTHVHTPLVPFWVTKQQCLGGVMVTASHNPKADNGYKVYAHNGAQIIPPVDAAIAASIDNNLALWPEALALLNRDDGGDGMLQNQESTEDPLLEATSMYMTNITQDLCRYPEGNAQSELKFMYTAMHGVGCPFVQELYHRFGFPEENLLALPAQCTPDPEFPTVRFPNPEEKGALNMALAEAEVQQTDYVIATDPDADRFVAAELQEDGQWHVFSGDELGVLFADWQMRHATGGLLICSAVSSRMLSALATHRGFQFAETLTGFKWMANESLIRRSADEGLVHLLAYEEAIGYQLSHHVPDKDGVSASATWCEMAAWHRRERQKRMTDCLEELRTEVGFFQTNNGYFISPDPAVTKLIFDDFRADGEYPINACGEFPISRVRDVTVGYDSGQPDLKCQLPVTPDAQMITLYFENQATVTLRGSGTEPKLKYYCEAKGSTLKEAREVVDSVAQSVIATFLKPEHYGLAGI